MLTVHHGGEVLELGAQWIHGGCHANNLFNFSLQHDLLGQVRSRQVRTLSERQGHFYTSSGRVISKVRQTLSWRSSINKRLQDVTDKAWDLYEEFNDFRNLDGRDTSVSLRDVYWDFVDEALEEEADRTDLELCLGGLSLALSSKVS